MSFLFSFNSLLNIYVYISLRTPSFFQPDKTAADRLQTIRHEVLCIFHIIRMHIRLHICQDELNHYLFSIYRHIHMDPRKIGVLSRLRVVYTCIYACVCILSFSRGTIRAPLGRNNQRSGIFTITHRTVLIYHYEYKLNIFLDNTYVCTYVMHVSIHVRTQRLFVRR